jgi:hypothetical protein
MKMILIIISFLLTACNQSFLTNSITISNITTKKASIESVDINGGTMTLKGTNLNTVTSITPLSSNITGHTIVIEEKSSESLRFRLENSIPATLNFVVGTILSFMVSSANAQSTVNVTVSSMPTGTVIAFDGASCPTGWSAYTQAEGRVIVGVNGAGNTDKDGAPLTNRTLSSTGGRELASVTIPAAKTNAGAGIPSDGDVLAVPSGPANRIYKTPDVLDTFAHIGDGDNDNMPPFITLKYCRKD